MKLSFNLQSYGWIWIIKKFEKLTNGNFEMTYENFMIEQKTKLNEYLKLITK